MATSSCSASTCRPDRMKRIRTLLVAILMVPVGGCAPDRDPSFVDDRVARLDHAELNPVVVKPTVVSRDTMFTIITLVRVVNDSQLVAVNFRQPYLRLIDRRTGRLVAMLGRGGG